MVSKISQPGSFRNAVGSRPRCLSSSSPRGEKPKMVSKISQPGPSRNAVEEPRPRCLSSSNPRGEKPKMVSTISHPGSSRNAVEEPFGRSSSPRGEKLSVSAHNITMVFKTTRKMTSSMMIFLMLCSWAVLPVHSSWLKDRLSRSQSGTETCSKCDGSGYYDFIQDAEQCKKDVQNRNNHDGPETNHMIFSPEHTYPEYRDRVTLLVHEKETGNKHYLPCERCNTKEYKEYKKRYKMDRKSLRTLSPSREKHSKFLTCPCCDCVMRIRRPPPQYDTYSDNVKVLVWECTKNGEKEKRAGGKIISSELFFQKTTELLKGSDNMAFKEHNPTTQKLFWISRMSKDKNGCRIAFVRQFFNMHNKDMPKRRQWIVKNVRDFQTNDPDEKDAETAEAQSDRKRWMDLGYNLDALHKLQGTVIDLTTGFESTANDYNKLKDAVEMRIKYLNIKVIEGTKLDGSEGKELKELNKQLKMGLPEGSKKFRKRVFTLETTITSQAVADLHEIVKTGKTSIEYATYEGYDVTDKVKELVATSDTYHSLWDKLVEHFPRDSFEIEYTLGLWWLVYGVKLDTKGKWKRDKQLTRYEVEYELSFLDDLIIGLRKFAYRE